MRSRQVFQFTLVCAIAVSIAGCSSLRSAAGENKDSPDEFAVVTKAPLVIPPDFNLRPPAAGAAPTNQLAPTQTAQAALFSSDPAAFTASLPATMSTGEKSLLVSAGAQSADPAIRQEIAADGRSTRAADDSFTNSLLFGSTAPSGTAPVDADAEARRIDAQKAGGTGAAPAPAPAPAPEEHHDSSWLGGLFDW